MTRNSVTNSLITLHFYDHAKLKKSTDLLSKKTNLEGERLFTCNVK